MNYILVASAAIVVFGIILLFVLASRRKYRDESAAPNYERIRNKLTEREEEEPEEEIEEEYEDDSSAISFGLDIPRIILAFFMFGIVMCIGLVVLGQLQSTLTTTSISTASYSSSSSSSSPSYSYDITNVTDSSFEALSNLTKVFPVMIILVAVMLILGFVISLTGFGNGSGGSEEEEEKEEPTKKKSNRHVKHYTKIRDKLTVREKKSKSKAINGEINYEEENEIAEKIRKGASL